MKKTVLTAVFAVLSTQAFAAATDDMKALLEANRDLDAYNVGRSQPDGMGEPAFDFYFGIAAINAGSPGEGVLALERYLLHYPDNRSAQFQLARGYFTLGDDARARQEFEALARSAQGSELYNINRFLDAIRSREAGSRPSLSYWGEAGFGRDTNINSGVMAGQIAGLPEGLMVTQGQSSERRADNIRSVSVGVHGTVPLRPGLALYGGASVGARSHVNARHDVFDQDTVSLYGGVSQVRGRHLWRAGVDLSSLNVDRQRYFTLATLSGEWQLQADQFNRYGVQAQWSRQWFENVSSYLEIDKITPVQSNADQRDGDVWVLNGSWRRSFLASWSPVLTASAHVGRERNRRERPDYSRDFGGFKFNLAATPVPSWTIGAGLGLHKSLYQAEFSTGLDARRDEGVTADAFASYALDRRWSLRMEFLRLDQRSNIGLYQYTRDALSVKLRYDSQ